MADMDDGTLSFKSVMDNDPMNAAIEETLRRIQGLSDGTVAVGGKMDTAFEQAGKAVEELTNRIRDLQSQQKQLQEKAINDAIIEEVQKSSGLFIRLFEEASQKNTNEIRKIMAETENLYAYLNGQAGATQPIGFSGEELERIKKDPKAIEAIRKAIGNLKKEVSGRSPFTQFADDMEKATGKMKGGDVAGGLEGIGRSVNAVTPQIKSLGNDLAKIFGDNKLGEEIGFAVDALDGLGATAAGVGRIMAGDIAGGVQNILSGMAKLVSVFDGLSNGKNKKLQEEIEYYNVLISVYDKLIDKQKELLNTLSGSELQKQEEKIAQLISGKQEAERKKMEDWFKSGAGWNSHSQGYKFDKKYGDLNAGDILRYSAEDFEKLVENNYQLWARLPQEVRDYGQAVITAKEQMAALKEATQEAFTGFSLDSFSQKFLDTWMDMDSSVEDFAKNMEKNLQKAVLNSLIDDRYKDQIRKLYADFANYNDDNVITEDEAARLQKANDDLAAQLIADRENLAKSFGWGSPEDSEAGKSLTGAVKGVSEETASLVGGQMNAMRINQLEATEILRQQLFHLANIDNHTCAINQNTAYNKYIKDIYDKLTNPADSLRSQGLG
ncbi:hypothetical protein EZS27_001720 [termite gut metagenome]|uniref:Uncharacterized protein n=1 Tax=termite gut metagenome TaxID=433724 RepID=A0A5J4SZR5_9ZZZZ